MSRIDIGHEWSEDGHCAISLSENEPNWRFSPWDLVGVTLMTAGGALEAIGHGLGALAAQCQAAANFDRDLWDEERQTFAQEQARAEMAGALEGLVLFNEPEVDL